MVRKMSTLMYEKLKVYEQLNRTNDQFSYIYVKLSDKYLCSNASEIKFNPNDQQKYDQLTL